MRTLAEGTGPKCVRPLSNIFFQHLFVRKQFSYDQTVLKDFKSTELPNN